MHRQSGFSTSCAALQAEALTSTRQRLLTGMDAGSLPSVEYVQACHSTLQEIVGSNTAKLVTFNLGYLPYGDKQVTTKTPTTVAAVEAALEVVCLGGLISIMAYVGHPGGVEEYEGVRDLIAGLSPSYWVSTEVRMLNRPTAPVLMMVWRLVDVPQRRG
ncbi:MAG: hypothetical protein WDW38_004415 [Sanguina aurantia]